MLEHICLAIMKRLVPQNLSISRFNNAPTTPNNMNSWQSIGSSNIIRRHASLPYAGSLDTAHGTIQRMHQWGRPMACAVSGTFLIPESFAFLDSRVAKCGFYHMISGNAEVLGFELGARTGLETFTVVTRSSQKS